MAIPTFVDLLLPLLRLVADDKEHFRRDVIEALSDHFQLTDAERGELLPSGQQTVIDNRVGWARTGLIKAGLLESPRRGVMRITTHGKDVLKKNPPAIDFELLRQFPGFVEWRSGSFSRSRNSEKSTPSESSSSSAEQTPEEALGTAYQELRNTLADDLLSRVLSRDSAFFERLVIKLLVKMGYGGSHQDAGKHRGKSGDGGIDGVINEDRLGLDVIYIQAKRWEDGTVGRPEIQKFVGALQGQRARKGVFITTSSFSNEAHEYVSQIDTKVVLIDGKHLANLMIDFNVGVSTVSSYEIKRIDSDYFEED
ncbi:MAG: restriction endonuclease [Proteobacteria bacterium]|nr:restriction endonuclease [Pseudomonadota bacterium]MCL2307914.1 restriction endonuclease [Pseudomonadota bacterium]